MALFLLILVLCLEAAFAIYCIRTKSMQHTLQSYARISALILYAAAVLSSVIIWSFRWYLLGAWLLVCAVYAGARLLHTAVLKRKGAIGVVGHRPAAKPGRVAGRAIGAVLLMAAVLTPAFVFPEHRPLATTGPHAIATAIRTYTDKARIDPYSKVGDARSLTVQFWYPEDAQKQSCPLVVFSHGSFGVKTSNVSMFEELASHGFVVASIDHTYQCLYTADAEGRTVWMDSGYLQEVQREDAHTDREQSFAYYQKWMGIRTADIEFVLGTVLAGAVNQQDGPCSLVDAGRIAVMGHSLGGAAALGVGRLRGDVDAVIALEAPFLCDITGVEEDGFQFLNGPYPVPVLNVYSDSAWGHLDEWTQYERNRDLRDNPGDTAETLHLPGTWHLDLTDLSRTSPFFTRMLNGGTAATDADGTLRTLNKACLAFLDKHLSEK